MCRLCNPDSDEPEIDHIQELTELINSIEQKFQEKIEELEEENKLLKERLNLLQPYWCDTCHTDDNCRCHWRI